MGGESDKARSNDADAATIENPILELSTPCHASPRHHLSWAFWKAIMGAPTSNDDHDDSGSFHWWMMSMSKGSLWGIFPQKIREIRV